ncbi:MAG: hypothetical protein JNK53_07780 [Phycisphaerae bacterium]|nr:hypothetical protein [Phycisphaerae bacterium]
MTNRMATLALGTLLACVVPACSHPQQSADPSASAPSSDSSFPGEPPAAFDPLGGEYPQIMWHCAVWEVPAECCFAPDATLQAGCGPKSNGMTIANAVQLRATIESIRSLPGTRHLASPTILTKPGLVGRIAPQDQDKSGASTGERSIIVEGTLADRAVISRIELSNGLAGALVSCEANAQVIPAGGALFHMCPGPEPTRPWMLVSVHPVVLRSVADYPFQRASPARR